MFINHGLINKMKNDNTHKEKFRHVFQQCISYSKNLVSLQWSLEEPGNMLHFHYTKPPRLLV